MQGKKIINQNRENNLTICENCLSVDGLVHFNEMGFVLHPKLIRFEKYFKMVYFYELIVRKLEISLYEITYMTVSESKFGLTSSSP